MTEVFSYFKSETLRKYLFKKLKDCMKGMLRTVLLSVAYYFLLCKQFFTLFDKQTTMLYYEGLSHFTIRKAASYFNNTFTQFLIILITLVQLDILKESQMKLSNMILFCLGFISLNIPESQDSKGRRRTILLPLYHFYLLHEHLAYSRK